MLLGYALKFYSNIPVPVKYIQIPLTDIPW